ncbi:hypothetical protein QDT73_06855 [Acinetobacter baumannii]|uniref:hypothetical protein n=1 Tax=Acinetobacter baumannii TaxID=470 RepID=UPI0024494FB9|nr:hypothetical protein [Acinetobacter baumannii]MDH2567080.1 hypothetical protein [Acinetobacter baumannii]
MTNLISNIDAFNAMLAGKQVLCRSANLNSEFDSIKKFHTDVFIQPGYEFCIKVELIELAGIQFTKPLTPHDVEDEQEIYIVMPMRVLRTKFDAENSEILCSVMNGFAQADAENATLQLQAIGATFGLVIGEVEIKDGFNDKPKKSRGKKEPQVKAEQSQVKENRSEVISAENQPAIVITEQTNVTTSEDLLVPETSDPDIKPNVNAQFEILLDAIRICQSEKELDSTCANLEKEGFSPDQIKSINEAKQNRLTELDAQEIDDVATTSKPENFESLVQSIQNAHTPEEVNSVVRYTSKWTEEQRKPLLNEMHKRLSELNQTKQQDDGLSPLIVRLQYAPDLNTLEELEREIPSRHPDVHKTLWNMAKKRRGELNAASTPSLDPDYLLGDNF